jgi:hypothetical protein
MYPSTILVEVAAVMVAVWALLFPPASVTRLVAVALVSAVLVLAVVGLEVGRSGSSPTASGCGKVQPSYSLVIPTQRSLNSAKSTVFARHSEEPALAAVSP